MFSHHIVLVIFILHFNWCGMFLKVLEKHNIVAMLVEQNTLAKKYFIENCIWNSLCIVILSLLYIY